MSQSISQRSDRLIEAAQGVEHMRAGWAPTGLFRNSTNRNNYQHCPSYALSLLSVEKVPHWHMHSWKLRLRIAPRLSGTLRQRPLPNAYSARWGNCA